MYWADETQTTVGLVADTDEMSNALIGTPYSEESIIWEWIKEFPVDQIDAYEKHIPVPNKVSMRQARLQLLASNQYETVNSAISTMGSAAQIEWEYATEVIRTNPLVAAMQQLLGWTDEQMDQYFIEASKL